ncbi:MAG TPA: hypothetical protein VIF14_17280 [Alphaproteobacteria bacterium]|jgi:hypothetical protein
MAEWSDVAAAYDGPIPPTVLAAARWGPGAWARLARGADAALIEARLRECVSVLGALRRAGAAGALESLARAVGRYRRLSVSLMGLG